MDIKYTIEILTKDIQDIEILVGKLQNSKEASAIELDLAMSKLRNVYEILTMIKADRLNELVDKSISASSDPEPEPETITEVPPEPAAEVTPEPEAEVPSEPEAEVPSEPEAEFEKEPVAEPEKAQVDEPEEEPVDEPETEPAAEVETEPVAEPLAEPDNPEEPGPGKAEKTILAEKFHAESSINENLAGKRSEQLEEKLAGQPIENIGRNIGINDRFLIIRELFDGNSEDFVSLINRLDNADNYQNASEILENHFADSREHDGIGILAGLVKRRYLR
jgi:hypothetical protein